MRIVVISLRLRSSGVALENSVQSRSSLPSMTNSTCAWLAPRSGPSRRADYSRSSPRTRSAPAMCCRRGRPPTSAGMVLVFHTWLTLMVAVSRIYAPPWVTRPTAAWASLRRARFHSWASDSALGRRRSAAVVRHRLTRRRAL